MSECCKWQEIAAASAQSIADLGEKVAELEKERGDLKSSNRTLLGRPFPSALGQARREGVESMEAKVASAEKREKAAVEFIKQRRDLWHESKPYKNCFDWDKAPSVCVFCDALVFIEQASKECSVKIPAQKPYTKEMFDRSQKNPHRAPDSLED